jgi:hypothetical protein
MIIIKQIQSMNLMLNMKDVNKILAKTHFKCQKKSEKKPHIFVKTCLPVMPSLLPLREKSSLPIFCKCGEPLLLVFLYLIAAYASVRQCVIIICRCPQNIIEISLSRKKCSSKYVVKNARNVTQFV